MKEGVEWAELTTSISQWTAVMMTEKTVNVAAFTLQSFTVNLQLTAPEILTKQNM